MPPKLGSHQKQRDAKWWPIVRNDGMHIFSLITQKSRGASRGFSAARALMALVLPGMLLELPNRKIPEKIASRGVTRLTHMIKEAGSTKKREIR